MPAWRELWRRAGGGNPFTSPHWFQSAQAWRECPGEVAFHAAFDGDDCVGVFPCRMQSDRIARLPVRALTGLVVPDTQEFDVLLEPGIRDAAAAALADSVRREGRWDVVRASRVREGARGVEALFGALRALGAHVATAGAEVALCLPIAGRWEDYYARRSRRLKKGNNLVANKLRQSFKSIDVVLHRPAGSVEAHELVETLTGLSAASWKVGTGTTLDEAGPGAFLRTLIPAAAEHGQVAVWALHLDGRVAAAELQLTWAGHVAALRSDFDRALEAHSPGTYLNWKLLEQSFGGEDAEYCMGPGRNAYKLRWSEREAVLHEWRAYSPTLRGRLSEAWAERAAPWLQARFASGRTPQVDGDGAGEE